MGLAVTTVGRPALADLLRSAAESSTPPAAVSVANQSGSSLHIDPDDYPFPLVIRASTGGASIGRNDAVSALPDEVTVVGFPNDDSAYPPSALTKALQRFAADDTLAGIACAPVTPRRYLLQLPPTGAALNSRTVWRAIEWAMFLDRSAFTAVGGFAAELGTGAASPWQSGEGTDLLLRLLAGGFRVTSAADIDVLGAAERRDLAPRDFVGKHRMYARGTGHVYRTHPYPAYRRLEVVLAPWFRMRTFDASGLLALRIALARSVGRLEGLLGRPFGRAQP